MRDQVDSWSADKHQSFLQVTFLFVVRHAQSTQVTSLQTSLSYFKKELRDKHDFLHVDKHQSFPLTDNIVFTVHVQSTQNSKFAIS